MNTNKIKISIVSYTNTLPFRWGLKNSQLIEEIDLQEDIPSICAQKLLFNQVDIALIPVAVIPKLNESYVVSNYCIGADGKVDSVKLYSDVPLTEIKQIILDYQSRTSVALTRVLAKEKWDIRPHYVDALPGFEENISETSAGVVIGDRTFQLNGKFNYEIDLSEEWKELTGLPFVFAAWVANKKVDTDFVSKFDAALKLGVDNISEAVKELNQKQILSNEDANNYLQKSISFSLDESKRQALNLFLDKLKVLK
ncbi:MAG: menaquinone biosynthetic enzyme MqnA/MqnD family protein [Bacteroidia bacterium]